MDCHQPIHRWFIASCVPRVVFAVSNFFVLQAAADDETPVAPKAVYTLTPVGDVLNSDPESLEVGVPFSVPSAPGSEFPENPGSATNPVELVGQGIEQPPSPSSDDDPPARGFTILETGKREPKPVQPSTVPVTLPGPPLQTPSSQLKTGIRPVAQPNTKPAIAAPGPANTSSPAIDSPLESASAAADEFATLVNTIQEQQKALESETDADDDVKADVQKRYQQALETIQLARDARQRIVQFKSESDAAPERVQVLKVEASQQLPEPQVIVSDDATLSTLEQQLAQVEAQLSEAKRRLAKLDEDATKRNERQTKIPHLTEKVKQQLTDLEVALAAAVDGEHPLVTEARKTELEARKKLLELQTPFYEAELHRYQALEEFDKLTRDQAARQLKHAEKLAQAWRDAVTNFRKAEAERKAREARDQVANAHPALKELAEANAELAEQRVQLSQTIESTAAEIESITEQLSRIEDEYKEVLDQEKAAGLTTALGLILRSRREELPDLGKLRNTLRTVESEIPRVQLEIMKLRDERDSLADIESSASALVTQLDLSDTNTEQVDVKQLVADMLQSKKSYADDLLNDLEAYLKHLGDLDLGTRKLHEQTTEYAAYIDKNVLWIRSTHMLSTGDLSDAADALTYFVSWSNYARFFSGVSQVARHRPIESSAVALILLLVLVYRQQIRRRLRELGESSNPEQTNSFIPTLKALTLTLISASLWPALMGLIAWRLLSLPNADVFTQSVAIALRATAITLWTLSFMRQLSRPGGVATTHFGWPSQALEALHSHLSWNVLIGLPLVFLVVLIDAHHVTSWNDSLGRILYILGMCVLARFASRVLNPRRGIVAKLDRDNAGWFQRMSLMWYLFAISLPVVFGGLAFVGYYYTVERLTSHLITTAWLGMLLVISHTLVTRWFFLIRSRLELRKAKHDQEIAARQELIESGKLTGDEPESLPENVFGDFDFVSITGEVQRLLRGAAIVGFAVGCWMIWANVLPALGILDRFELWNNTVQVTETIENADGQEVIQTVDRIEPTTLAHVFLAVLILGATGFASRNVPGLIEVALLQRLPLDQGGRHAVTTIFRYTMTLIGVVFACRMIGITWSSVQWLVAAMTVGLGFGLQEIFANFVSGLILLIERPLRIGDLVTVGNVTGNVAKMHIRATTIVDYDRREMIVPNKKFITDDFVNWTLSDPITRVVFPIGIAYGSDTNLANEILNRVAKEHPLVLEDPAPSALFQGFGDSTLDFQLRVFIPRRDCYTPVVHELNSKIEQEFNKAGIEIAFPQRDLNIRSIEGLEKFMPLANVQNTANAGPTIEESQRKAA